MLKLAGHYACDRCCATAEMVGGRRARKFMSCVCCDTLTPAKVGSNGVRKEDKRCGWERIVKVPHGEVKCFGETRKDDLYTG